MSAKEAAETAAEDRAKFPKEVGRMGVITHPLNGQRGRLLRAVGIQELPFDPCRAMIVRMPDLRMHFREKA
ncbi:MAG: hypothetical protein ACR65X_09030 [Methylocystis sp.]